MTITHGVSTPAGWREPFLNLDGFRRLPLVHQTEATECGLACLAMVAGYHGYDADLASLRRRFSISMKGATLKSLTEIAGGLGMSARAVRLEPDELSRLRLPAVLHWDMNHFVVLQEAGRHSVTVHDPAIGVRRLTHADVSQHFTGVALELTPTPAFQRKRERQVLRLESLVSMSPEAFGALTQAVLLTLVIEACVLAAPFYMQLVIDDAILKGDADLMAALAVGFALVTLFNVAASFLRGLALQFVANVLGFQMEARLFHHLVRLPLDYFQKRQMGDIQSRFMAIEPIKQFLSQGALSALFDSVLSVVIAAVMVIYAPELALIAFASLALYAVLRLSLIELQKRVAGDYLLHDAREQTRFLETLRAAQTLKVAGAEAQREDLQQSAIAATTNSGIRSGNLSLGYGALNQALSGLTDILLVFVAARAVMAGDLTVGMLSAFMAYKGQFSARAVNLIEQLIEWRMLDVQLERLADIALTPAEPRIDEPGSGGEIAGGIELRRVMFRYAPGEPDVLKGADLVIRPGEFVAIAGPSGAGKSTLLKLLVGLYQPHYGEVLADGRPIAAWGVRNFRRQIGVVSQDDVLLAGSIAENVAFFDDAIDMEAVAEACRLAAIHDEIVAMPMGYQSLVGDMGSSLSGGQKQRVLIARALYRRPKILVMDEGTSHLDVANERAINAALQSQAITRIAVAHRPETLAAADRVLVLAGGVLMEAPKAPGPGGAP